MPHPREIELKIELRPQSSSDLARLPLLKGVSPEKVKALQSVYFDTEKQKLRKSGLSLRVRQDGTRHVQTIKQSNGHGVGLFERNEWECEIVGSRPDLDAARGTALEPLLNKKLRRDLKPVFETRVRRQVYPIHRNGSEIELTLDKGRVEAAGRSSPLCEVELELKAGEPGELFKVVQEFGDTFQVHLASKSKADHGYELLDQEEPHPVRAEPIALPGNADWATAFKVVARACLYQVVANEPALRRNDPEAVHQMRVGLRRLRAAISVFKDMIDGPQAKAMQAELKWLTGELGPAREFDVFIERVVKPSDGSYRPGSGFGAVAKDFRRRRAQAFDRANDAVGSARYRNLVLDATAWIEIGDWARNEDELVRVLRERPVADGAAAELSRRRKRLRKRGARLAELDTRQRHKLRISAKKLRYAIEFFASAFPGGKSAKRREKFVVKLKELQDALGDLNDIMVHEDLARQVIESPGSDTKRGRRSAKKAFAAGRLSGGEGARFASVMKASQRAYAGFVKAAPFWV